jgi:hypothetical protein
MNDPGVLLKIREFAEGKRNDSQIGVSRQAARDLVEAYDHLFARLAVLEAENERLGRAYGERCRLAHEREAALEAVCEATAKCLAMNEEYDDAVQRRDWQTCEQLEVEQEAAWAAIRIAVAAASPEAHDCADHVVQAGEGTAYCARCEDETRSEP